MEELSVHCGLSFFSNSFSIIEEGGRKLFKNPTVYTNSKLNFHNSTSNSKFIGKENGSTRQLGVNNILNTMTRQKTSTLGSTIPMEKGICSL